MKGQRSDGLPDWVNTKFKHLYWQCWLCICHITNWLNLFQVWFEDGFVFSKFIPSCIDPTHCDTDPPEPSPPNVVYIKPELGSLKYGDGEIINYKCQNPSRLFQIIHYVVSIEEAFSVNINVKNCQKCQKSLQGILLLIE